MEDLKEKIRNHFEKEFSSSPVDIDETEVDIVIASECQCDSCGQSVFEMDDFPVFRDGEFLCEHCEIEKYYSTCPICQDHFEHATCAADFKLLISKEAIEEFRMEIAAGFYLTKEWPFYYGNCVTGFDGVFENSLELVRECDIESMLTKLDHRSAGENLNGEVCPECFDKWTGKVEPVNNYCDQEYGARYIAKMIEVIKEGK